MEKLSESLADRLEAGAAIYVNVDQQQGQLLDNQMRED